MSQQFNHLPRFFCITLLYILLFLSCKPHLMEHSSWLPLRRCYYPCTFFLLPTFEDTRSGELQSMFATHPSPAAASSEYTWKLSSSAMQRKQSYQTYQSMFNFHVAHWVNERVWQLGKEMEQSPPSLHSFPSKRAPLSPCCCWVRATTHMSIIKEEFGWQVMDDGEQSV